MVFVFGYIYFEGWCGLFRIHFIVRIVKRIRKLRWVECVQSDSKLLSELQWVIILKMEIKYKASYGI